MKKSKRIELQQELEKSFTLESLPTLYLVGRRRHINTKNSENYAQVERFWDECKNDGTLDKLKSLPKKVREGFIGVCGNFNGREYDYWICVECEFGYEPDPELQLEIKEVRKLEYAAFDCTGSAEAASREKWKWIYNTFYPNANYEQAYPVELELHSDTLDRKSENYSFRLLTPVKFIDKSVPNLPDKNYIKSLLTTFAGVIIGALVGAQYDKTVLGVIIGGVIAMIYNGIRNKAKKQ